MNGCSESGIAARLCGDLVLAGYSDWYLPSKDELARLYENRVAVGGFASEWYWSSTELNNNKAWGINFASGATSNHYSTPKSNTFSVRAVRAF